MRMRQPLQWPSRQKNVRGRWYLSERDNTRVPLASAAAAMLSCSNARSAVSAIRISTAAPRAPSEIGSRRATFEKYHGSLLWPAGTDNLSASKGQGKPNYGDTYETVPVLRRGGADERARVQHVRSPDAADAGRRTAGWWRACEDDVRLRGTATATAATATAAGRCTATTGASVATGPAGRISAA